MPRSNAQQQLASSDDMTGRNAPHVARDSLFYNTLALRECLSSCTADYY